MPFPQQVVDRLARETPKTPGWSLELLAFSLAVFAISVIVYAGIAFGYRPYVEAQIQKLNDQIQLFTQQVPASDQEKIAAFYAQLINLKNILGSRPVASPVLAWLEGRTETHVTFTSLSLDLSRRQIVVSGIAQSINDVGLEARILEQDPNVQNVIIGNVTETVSRGSQFSMTITLAPGMFRFMVASSTTP